MADILAEPHWMMGGSDRRAQLVRRYRIRGMIRRRPRAGISIRVIIGKRQKSMAAALLAVCIGPAVVAVIAAWCPCFAWIGPYLNQL